MARPGGVQFIDTGGGRPSRTSAFIDAATQATSAWIDHQKRQKDEDEAVKWLVPYISNLGPKERGPLMVKLSAEHPRLFARVAGQIGTAAVDPAEQQAQDLTDQLTGYNRNPQISMERAAPPPPPQGPLGMLGGAPQIGNPLGFSAPAAPYDPNKAKATTPPGYAPLPTSAFERALMLSYRGAAAFGDKALAQNMTDLNLGTALPPEKQTAALRVGLKLSPEANKVAEEAGQNIRNERTTAATLRGQDYGLREKELAAEVDRERIAADSTKPTLEQLKTLQSRMDANNAEIRRVQRGGDVFGLKISPETMDKQVNDLNRKNAEIKIQMDALRSAPKPAAGTALAPKTAEPTAQSVKYTADQEADIKVGMAAEGGPYPRAVVIARMKDAGLL